MENKDLLQEEEDNIVTFVGEDGEEIQLEYLDSIDYQGKEYLALLPVEEEDNSVVFLEVEPVDEENENYLTVEDDEILEAIYAIFKENFKDILTFED